MAGNVWKTPVFTGVFCCRQALSAAAGRRFSAQGVESESAVEPAHSKSSTARMFSSSNAFHAKTLFQQSDPGLRNGVFCLTASGVNDPGYRIVFWKC
jgi:hypothetical protein